MASFSKQLIAFWLHRVHPQIASLVAVMGTLWLGLCLLAIFAVAKLSNEVWEREAFAFDETILLKIHQFATPALDRLMLGMTHLGNPSVVIPLAGLVLGYLLWRGDRPTAQLFFLNCLGGVILSAGLKLAFGKARPQLWPPLISETTFSYPSGHALGSMVLYGFLAYLLATHIPQFSRLIYIFVGGLIAAIGFSRLYLGVHWPTDVLAGYGIGFLWLMATLTVLRLQQAKP